MPRKQKHHTKQFKLDAVAYRKEHPDLNQVECAKNLGIGVTTLSRWEAQFKENDGDIPVRVQIFVRTLVCESFSVNEIS